MTDFGNRFDRIATQATRDVPLANPALASQPTPGAPTWAKLGGVVAAIALVIGGFVAIQWGNGDGAEPVIVGDDGDVSIAPAPGYCAVGDLLPILRSGLPTYDYQPSGSFADLAAQADVVVTGTITEVVGSQSESDGFTELTVADVVSLDGEPRADITIIAYDASWADRADPDPLAEPMGVEGVDFIAFLSPWSGRRGDWAPGVEGLYVACGAGTPIEPVIENAAGPDDPTNPTIAELSTLLLAPVDGAADAAQQSAEAQEDPEGLLVAAEAIRDAVLQFADGEALAIEEIPLDAEVALALGDTIEAVRTNTELRDPLAWTIERDEFQGYAGPFSTLDVLAGVPHTTVTLGDHPRCVADPTTAPAGFEDFVRISIQPAEDSIDSCLQWYAVDLFYDPDAGTVGAISLDLFGP